ncbi:MAG: aminotransferase class I/II-fold pyridoxal phosphate-dependent enzyme, partial [Sphingobacterium sp.]
VVLASLAKGLGTDAGVILGESSYIEKIKKHPIFLGASPASPAALYAMINGKEIYAAAFEKLQANTQLLVSKITDLPIRSVNNFPVFTANLTALNDRLISKGIVISSFPYPLPTSPLLNRIVVTAGHTKQDILDIASALRTEIY